MRADNIVLKATIVSKMKASPASKTHGIKFVSLAIRKLCIDSRLYARQVMIIQEALKDEISKGGIYIVGLV